VARTATTGDQDRDLGGWIIGIRTTGDVVVFSPDSHTLASGSYDRMTGPPGGVTSVVFSPDGNKLASGGADGKIRLRDVSLSDPLAMRKISRAVHRIFTQSERSIYLADQPFGTTFS
jgi:WD40 repeat protein